MYKSFSSNHLKQASRVATISKNLFSNSCPRLKINDEWKKLAEKQLKGKSPESLIWHTPEVLN